VKTKYFLSFDDDLVVSKRSNITTMLEMLDTMDISLVGGKFNKVFAGFLEFANVNETGAPALMYYPGSCTVESQELTSYRGCYRCDLTANGFMARTQDILDVGGWSKELKMMEHKDIFLRLKAAGKKVVYCEKFQIKNLHSDNGVDKNNGTSRSYDKESYTKLRVAHETIMKLKFLNHWNVATLERRRKDEWPHIWN
jgi:GT2 family glycosyltransferase